MVSATHSVSLVEFGDSSYLSAHDHNKHSFTTCCCAMLRRCTSIELCKKFLQFYESISRTKTFCLSSGRYISASRSYATVPQNSLDAGATPVLSNVTDEFKIIYRFPYITVLRTICRLKIYQTTVTSLAVPVVGCCTYTGILPSEVLTYTLAIGSLALFMLFVMGEIFRRTVGIIYYNSIKDIVKVSHLTFWGRRRDVLIPVEDIVPFTDTSERLSDIYTHLLRYSEPKNPLYLCLRFGGIKDLESFNEIFGDISGNSKLT
ncbi:hypothetical protein SK128_017331 [Halocaridina rubra]|uniref:Transmembrane protein 186 n=1 Tax=Halocaridina rubra TaxID=373956 RepID=A0AAN9ABW0_HALRR